ncbi:MAG: glycoside hydrolase family 27 protein [Acidomyces sp. 'richmondensis']|nr:MAG: glycoside hydrolase family 27 protein [Acidomyces sp. 'richmondensis']
MRHPQTSLALLFLPAGIRAVNNGLARTPPMGWNNWNSLGCDVSESLLLDTAQILVRSGLRDMGYEYVVLDDCWSSGRSQTGHLLPDLTRFPSGMKSVSDALHAQNLRFGMYSSAGEMTCAHYAGSLDHEVLDAESWAAWGVDYLKYDNCYSRGRFGTPQISFDRYNTMALALNATGRAMVYSLCNWGEDYVHAWGVSIANSWRVTGDVYDSFSRPDAQCSCVEATDPLCVSPGNHCSILYIINRVAPIAARGEPGGWNDLDMLEVGLGGMQDEEYVAHFSLWAALKSPLLIGADLRKLGAKALSVLNNPAVVALNQDPLGRPVTRIMRREEGKKDQYGIGETQIWSGPLYGGDQVVVFLNAADETLEMKIDLDEIFASEGPGGSAPHSKVTWAVHDLWAERMDEKTAGRVLHDGKKVLDEVGWYNASAISYREGLERGDERLMGKKIGEVAPGEDLKAQVPRHGVKVFRLRSVSGEALKRYAVYRDEL